MTYRLFRLPLADRLRRCLAMAAIVIAALTVPAHTVPVAAAGPTAPVAAGPASWVDDLSPIVANDWSEALAAHLIERAGFGATPGEITRLAAMTPRQVVDEQPPRKATPSPT